jgi:DNA ligase (NAD+)
MTERNTATAQEQIDLLRQTIRQHDYNYYIAAQPTITDLEYDKLMRELQSLETAHPDLLSADSPTQKVGGAPIAGFQTVAHRLPMLSIDNAYTEAEIREFDQRVRKLLDVERVNYTLEYKIDGVALSLIYIDGSLTQALTRGNGQEGDDVTHNARTIHNIPLKLRGEGHPPLLEIRGEAYIPNAKFAQLRAEQLAREEEPYANPRNAAAGALKLLDPKLSQKRQIHFFAHGIGAYEGITLNQHFASMQQLVTWGMPITPDLSEQQDIEHVLTAATTYMEQLHALDFEVDGLVIKVNDYALREQLGNTSKSPRWVIAYKWERYEATTKVQSITINVGKTGALTPVANLEPVLIAGTTVSRASLHNFEEMERLGIKIHDTVLVEKAGKIIPHIVRVEQELRTGAEVDFSFPTMCPECQTAVVKDEDGVYVRCPNLYCPAQLRESLRYFASRSAMNIDGLGIKLIEQLVDAGLLTSFADIYRLPTQREALLSLNRLGQKSIDNLMTGIEVSKRQPAWRLLTALNIRHIGTRTAQVLMKQFGAIPHLAEQTSETLAAVNEIGPVIAHSVDEFFHSEHGQLILRELSELGLNLGEYPSPGSEQAAASGEAGSTGFFTQKTVVITGTLETYTREQIESLIMAQGGKAGSSVSSKTDYLIAGEKAGSKLSKAQELGIKILTEAEAITFLTQPYTS